MKGMKIIICALMLVAAMSTKSVSAPETDAFIQPATLYETYDNIVVFETKYGELYEVYVTDPETLDVYREYILFMAGGAVVQVAQR